MHAVARLRRPLIRYRMFTLLGLMAVLALSGCVDQQASANPPAHIDAPAEIAAMQKMAPYRGYLEAHQEVQQPLALWGGPSP